VHSAYGVLSVGCAVSSLSQRLDALESAGIDTTRRLSEAETLINAKTDNQSEIAAVRDCVTSAVAHCESQLSELGVLRVQLAREAAKEANNTVSEQTESTGERRSFCEFVDAEQIELVKKPRDAASTAGTGGEAAQRLSAVQEEQAATTSAVKFVTESDGFCNPSHLQAVISACTENSRTARAETEDVKTRLLALEKAVCFVTLKPPSARQITDEEAHAPNLYTWSQQRIGSSATVPTPLPPPVAAQFPSNGTTSSSGVTCRQASAEVRVTPQHTSDTQSPHGSAAIPVSAPVRMACQHTSDARSSSGSAVVQALAPCVVSQHTSDARSPRGSAVVPVSAPVRMVSQHTSDARSLPRSSFGSVAAQAPATVCVASQHTSDARSSSSSAMRDASCSLRGPEAMQAQRPLLTVQGPSAYTQIPSPLLALRACCRQSVRRV